MDVILENISKRYIHEWVFRNINLTIPSGGKMALVGPNGSGKSTLLQIISGYRLPTEGKVKYNMEGKDVPAEGIYNHISFASPYLELIEEFTLLEQLQFHFTWKDTEFSLEEIAEIFQLNKALEKPIKYFSSGMKQRLKLAIAFASDSEVLLLDEPTSNLDESGINIYEECLEKLLKGRTVIIASNDKREYAICEELIALSNYK